MLRHHLSRRAFLSAGCAAVGLGAVAACVRLSPPAKPQPLQGQLIAVGVPGAGAISPVGIFHPGGPNRDTPKFAAMTEKGKVLDKARLLVASASNFAAPKGISSQATGAVLSIDPNGDLPLVVPPTFATGDGQAAALDGRVLIFSTQSPAFSNRTNNPDAVTAGLPSVSAPTGISINNAFGRVWMTNAPEGLTAPGTNTVLDADGRPLAGAPSKRAGGVFVGTQTDREPQRIPGSLTSGALGNALMGKSPDGSGRAVFAVVQADGSLIQVHVERGIDGLAPPGTIRPFGSGAPGRAGIVFNWTPDRILYASDPLGNAIIAATLDDDGTVFRVQKTARLAPSELNVPIDLSPAVPEVANGGFSSNTTLAGGSDIYVANRGNGTIARLRQDGTVLAVRRVQLPDGSDLGPGRLNGLAVSPDATRLWVTADGELAKYPGCEGLVLGLPAFGGAQAG